MNLQMLNPKNWFNPAAITRKALQGQPLTTRDSLPQGPWTGVHDDWIAREVAPRFYEAIREAVPVVDAAINRLVTLDGIVRVEGDNETLVSGIEDWMFNVQVGDMQHGFQAFYAGQGNELYEQGFSIGEAVLNSAKNTVARLNVADSKGVYFRRVEPGKLDVYYRDPAPVRNRNDGTDNVERVLRNNYQTTVDLQAYLDKSGFVKLRSDSIVYAGLNNEACNAYGVSLLRSMEFVTKILLTIDNATLQTWQRFGSPSFDVQYKTKSKISAEELEKRRKTISDNLKAAMDVKGDGNTTDLITALGINDELVINVLGAGGDVLEIEQSAKHILEQIVAKTGLPPWILGYVWGTAERLALKQAELLLQESKTRFELRRPGLEKIVAMHLRASGVTWNKGDWKLVQELPNMQDILAMAQAEFLQAQTELMQSNTGDGMGAQVSESGKVLFPGDEGYRMSKAQKKTIELDVNGVLTPEIVDKYLIPAIKSAANREAVKIAIKAGEPYAENDKELPRIERRAIKAAVDEWQSLYTDVIAILGVNAHKAASGENIATKMDEPVFVFDAGLMLEDLLQLEPLFIEMVGGEDAELAGEIFNAWLRGELNSAAEFEGVNAITEGIREFNRQAMAQQGLEQVKATTARIYRNGIVKDLQDGIYDGVNPQDVARKLKQRFDINDYDWERLARSEVTAAHGRAKIAQYQAHEVDQYNYTTSGDAKVSAICRRLAAAGPYRVGGGPLPMTSSHPGCRCTTTAVIS